MQDNTTNTKSERAIRECTIQKFWHDNHIFNKTIDESKNPFVFYDGPPFGTGLPHYGHILAGTIKDAIPRYQTMQGFSVPRTWGWDCHGLPVENLIEKKLNLATKKDIEDYGIDKFNKQAEDSVLEYASEWKDIIPRLGRFVDMEHDYKTMDATYTESIWWAFGELYKKGLIYEGYKIMHLCPRCETTLSNFEVTQGYKDITDISVYAKFKLTEDSATDRYVIAWTTTPWTLPGNVALAINKEERFIEVRISGEEGTYIFAQVLLDKVLKDKTYEIVKDFSGNELIGLSYEPVFDYYIHKDIENKDNVWKIYHADFVTNDSGTGVVHIAPAFGEDDKKLADDIGLPFIQHVGTDGRFKSEVTHFAHVQVKPKENHQATDIEIIKWLAHNHKLFAKEKIIHSYPHCWRCDTPLLNYASSSWFVRVTELKDKLIEANKEIVWVPDHIRDGRFGKWLEGARDWAISRARYWGAPLPVWKNKEGEHIVISSVDVLKKYTKKSGNTYYMIRHGEAESNIKRVVSYEHGNVTPLTLHGVEQVRASAEELKNKGITKLIVSPFLRTTQTARIIQEVLGLTEDALVFDERLIDINAGIFEGRTWQEYFDMFRRVDGTVDQYARFTNPPEGGETLMEVKKRVGVCLYDIEKTYSNETILFVGHGASLWMLESIARGATIEETIRIRYGANHGDALQDYIGNASIRLLDFVPIPHNESFELDLHRPYIDTVELLDSTGPLRRVSEVFDCWFESGSMPFASLHYMGDDTTKEGKLFKERYPADFIAEGLDQTRGWFYSLMVLGIGLFNKAPFKHVIVNGLILAEDGQKMSKRLQNYPELLPLVDTYGADALRYYLLGSPAVRGEELRLSEKDIALVSSKILGRLENVVSFYELYRDTTVETNTTDFHPTSVLDIWMLSRLHETRQEVTKNMEQYELDKAVRPFDLLIDDISTWYLRRSREALKNGIGETKTTLYIVLKTLAQLLAPFTPFIAENIWQKLRLSGDAESVHLTPWPTEIFDTDTDILNVMDKVRQIVTLGLDARQKANIKVRQPLRKIEIKAIPVSLPYIEILKDELNVKEIEFTHCDENDITITLKLDTEITQELKQEGDMRELARALQDLRKELNLTPDQLVSLIVETDEYGTSLIRTFEQELKKKIGLQTIIFQSCEGKVITIDTHVFRLGIIV